MGDARDRTRLHLGRLLAAAAATASLAGCEDGCGGGYGVVDPMPAPSRCPGVAKLLTSSAKWRKEGDKLVIDVVIQRPADRPDVVFTQTVQAGYGALSAKGTGGQELRFTVEPDPHMTGVNVEAAFACSAAPLAQLHVMIQIVGVDAGAWTEATPLLVVLGE